MSAGAKAARSCSKAEGDRICEAVARLLQAIRWREDRDR